MIEKREWRRIETHLQATIRWASSAKAHKARIVNITPQGCCFVCDRELAMGTKVELTANFRGAGIAKLLSEVVWSGFLKKTGRYVTGVMISTGDRDEYDKFLKFYNLHLLSVAHPS